MTVAQFSSVIANAPLAIVVLDAELRVTEWNPAASLLFGTALPRALLDEVRRVRPAVVGGDAVSGLEIECTLRAHDAGALSVAIAPFPDMNEQTGLILMAEDVSERRRAAQALGESQERYHELFQNATDVIFTVDLEGRFTSVNRAGLRVSGYSADEVVGMNMDDVIAPEYHETVRRRIAQKLVDDHPTTYDVEIVTRSGARVALELSTRLIRHGGRPVEIQGIGRDVSDRRAASNALQHQALHDPLTDLPNRTLFYDRLMRSILSCERQQANLAVLLIDLDRFKDVNDTLGHQYGDSLLEQVGPRLQRVLRESDTVARLGGDEFSILLPGTDARGAVNVARKLLDGFREPFLLDGHSFQNSASVGVAIFPQDGEDAQSLMRSADIAMYVAKRQSIGYARYSPDQDEHTPSRLMLSGELRDAIEFDRLHLHFQPKIDLATGAVESVETLVRWHHPTYGPVPPDRFIPVAEQTGLIRPLTLWVLQSALLQCRMWREEGIRLRVGVNLSVRNLQDARLPESVAHLLSMMDVPADCLEVEITEAAFLVDAPRTFATVERLHEMGVRIALDDFGTGYSSLGSLTRLPIHEIKIDRSFVATMGQDVNSATIVRSVVDLGHNLGLRVVAEGVETEEVYDSLRALGCDVIQGYYLSRPLSAPDLGDWLNSPDSTIAYAR